MFRLTFLCRGVAVLSLLSVLLVVSGRAALASEGSAEIPEQHWSWQGFFGGFDRAELQRGYQVYTEICAACHAVNYLNYRNLADLGYSPEQIKAIAADVTVQDGLDDDGEMFERPGLPSDPIARPFPSDKVAAAANNGAVPKDLSMIAKARAGSADYLFALLAKGYKEEIPHGVEIRDGQYYNEYFPGNVIAMAPPLGDADLVTYQDGTKATIEQMARDVVAFMTWAAEPSMELRKRLGLRVVIFFLALSLLSYAAMRLVWRDIKKTKA